MLRFFLLWVLGFGFTTVKAQTLTVQGNWNNASAGNNTVSEAGKDYGANKRAQSGKKKTKLTVNVNNGNGSSWSVQVAKVEFNWPSAYGMKIHLRRTGTGTGGGSTMVTGGDTYQEITSLSLPFINGIGKRKKIPIQYKIDGFSVLVPVDNYSCNIVYTVTSP